MKSDKPHPRNIRNYDKHAAIVEHHEFHEPEKPERYHPHLFPLIGTRTLIVILGIIVALAVVLAVLGLIGSHDPEGVTNILGGGDRNQIEGSQVGEQREREEGFVPSLFSQFLPQRDNESTPQTLEKSPPERNQEEKITFSDQTSSEDSDAPTLTNKDKRRSSPLRIFTDAKKRITESNNEDASESAVETSTSTDVDDSSDVTTSEEISWSVFTDDTVGIQFEYPSDWSIKTVDPGSVVFGENVHYTSLWDQSTLSEAQELLNYISWDVQKLVRIDTEYQQKVTPSVTYERWNLTPGSTKLNSTLCPEGVTVDRFAVHIDGTDSIVTFSIPEGLCLDVTSKAAREEIMEHMASHVRIIHDPYESADERVTSKQKEAQVASLIVSITLHHDESGVCPMSKDDLRDVTYKFYDELYYSVSPDGTSCHIGMPVKDLSALSDDSDFDSSAWVGGFTGDDSQGCTEESDGSCYDFKLPL